MLRRVLLFLGAIAFCGPAISAWSQAPKSPERLILILDASGSMWGQVGGENKIVIARRVMKNLVNKLDDKTKVGLVVYGHRREKDCEDIEVVTPLAAVSKAALAQQIDGLNPKGMTPITGAIRRAVVAATTETGPTTVVLFTDGLETCGGDPCQAVSKARAAGTNLVLHVIGFDVSKEDVSQLECAAQAGGGLYLNAGNADELTAAFERAVAPADPSNAVISVKAVADGELTDALVTIFLPGTHKEVASGRTYVAASTNPRLLPVVAGQYDVEVRALKFKGEATQTFSGLKLSPGDTVKKVVDFSSGELAIHVTRNSKLSDASITVYASGTMNTVASGRSYTDAKSNPRVFKLTPGTFDVVIRSVEISGGPEKRIDGIVVKAAARSDHAHNFESATLRLGAVSGNELVDATVQVVNAASGVTAAQGRTYTNANSNPKSFELMPGRYRVVAKAIKSKSEKSVEVTVAAGQVVEEKVDFAK